MGCTGKILWISVAMVLLVASFCRATDRHSGFDALSCEGIGIAAEVDYRPKVQGLHAQRQNLKADESAASPLLESIATQLSQGFVHAHRIHGSVSAHRESLIDLSALVADCVSRDLVDEDSYWQYYAHCDRWDICFARSVALKDETPISSGPIHPDPSEQSGEIGYSLRENIEWAVGKLMKTAGWFGAIYRELEFVVIENQKWNALSVPVSTNRERFIGTRYMGFIYSYGQWVEHPLPRFVRSIDGHPFTTNSLQKITVAYESLSFWAQQQQDSLQFIENGVRSSQDTLLHFLGEHYY